MAIISGNNADNVLNGTADDDRIVGQGGNDTINGNASDDFILWRCGDGDDIIDGGDGFSPFSNLVSNVERITVSGEGGNDTLVVTPWVLNVNISADEFFELLRLVRGFPNIVQRLRRIIICCFGFDHSPVPRHLAEAHPIFSTTESRQDENQRDETERPARLFALFLLHLFLLVCFGRRRNDAHNQSLTPSLNRVGSSHIK